MALKVAAKEVDFDRMAQLIERMRVSDPKAERWTAAFDELRGIIAAQGVCDDNVVSLELTPAA